MDLNTQFPYIEMIKRAQEEAEVASANGAVNRAQREERASEMHKNFTEQRHTYSYEDCLFEFNI